MSVNPKLQAIQTSILACLEELILLLLLLDLLLRANESFISTIVDVVLAVLGFFSLGGSGDGDGSNSVDLRFGIVAEHQMQTMQTKIESKMMDKLVVRAVVSGQNGERGRNQRRGGRPSGSL